MIFLNEAEKKQLSKEHYKTFLKLLSPIAPHIAEELWESLGELTSVHLEEWPLFDESKIIEEAASIAVQVNGKVRATIEVPTDASQEEIQTKIDETDELTNWLEGGYEIKKIVPNRLISLVTK
jgi:leucyl-tRNA synthetase